MNYNIFTPVPIDITYTVTIVSKYQSDIDMILSNFIPFFNKDLFFQCEHPKFTDLTYKNQVIMENTIQEDHIPEIEANQDDIVTATCTFTFKTFLFCGTLKKERVVKEIVQENISTIISVHPMEILSTYVYELTKNDVDNIDKFLIEHPDCKLSTILSIELTADVSTEVSVTTSSVISVEEEVSEGLIPPIHQIAFGFYDTPYTSAHVPFINEVDELCANGYDDKPGVDRMIMRVTNDVYDYALSSPYPSKDWEWPNVKK